MGEAGHEPVSRRKSSGEAIAAVLTTSAATVTATQLTRAAQSGLHAPAFVMYIHIAMMALLLPLARSLAQGGRYAASSRDVCVFLPLWVVSNYSLVQALALTPAGVVQTLFGTGPSQVALLSRIFLAERFTVARTVAVLLAFAGATVLASRSGFQRKSGMNVVLGSFFALAAVFASACYKVSFKVRLGAPPPHVVLGTVGTLGMVTAIFGLPVVLLLAELGVEDRWWSSSVAVNWPLVIGSAAVDVVYNTSIAWGLAVASPVFISVGVVLGTPVNMLIDATVHGEMPSAAQCIGTCLIAVSFTLLVCVPVPRSESVQHGSSDSLILSAREAAACSVSLVWRRLLHMAFEVLLSGAACFPAALRSRQLDTLDAFGSGDCLRSASWWLCLLGVSTNYLMHGFIWNYSKRFAALCDKPPLKLLGSHPVDVFASLEVVAKLVQAGSVGMFLGPSGRSALWEAARTAPAWCWAVFAGLLAAGQALNAATYNAIGNAGVYYGFKLGRTVPWCHGFPFNTGLRHPQYLGVVLTLFGALPVVVTRELTQLGLPHLVLVWGSMYGVMSAMEQAGDNDDKTS
ncbi:Solute carrier family 35 member F3 [Symbiodinium microadriaticum]|uniref:Solute carrier family 35 member F3 n=1 Tax=Symbiodinium microadriaticum TaxID=2951 RepID=A0A1Q9EGW2_SYMMI|nr:Solute carrier family 35 member F3 [Symbiodinium microadriaticum]